MTTLMTLARRIASLLPAVVLGALVLGAGVPTVSLAQPAAFELVTPADVQAERLAPEGPRTRSMPRPGAPAIRVLAPVQGEAPAAVPAPLRIELAFEPANGNRIVPDSFRLQYGMLKLDLTERMRRHATISERGVVVERAQMPDGLHRLFVQVSDDKGNQAEHEMRVRVGPAP